MLLQIVESAGILESLAKLSPVIGCLILFIIYLLVQVNKKDNSIKELNEYIRASDRENLKTLSEVNETLTTVLQDAKANSNMVISELSHLKEFIKDKLK